VGVRQPAEKEESKHRRRFGDGLGEGETEEEDTEPTDRMGGCEQPTRKVSGFCTFLFLVPVGVAAMYHTWRFGGYTPLISYMGAVLLVENLGCPYVR
jgi:hypothetical protein